MNKAPLDLQGILQRAKLLKLAPGAHLALLRLVTVGDAPLVEREITPSSVIVHVR